MPTVIEIHGLIFTIDRFPKFLPITHKFDLNFDARLKKIGFHKIIEHQAVFETGIGSIHALYGENGCGKTELLLQIAQTFTQGDNSQKVGVLYTEDDILKIYRGAPLGGWNSGSDALNISRRPPLLGVIFYSTSPFENRRRAHLKKAKVIDVSPPFGRDLYFDGLSLLETFDHIKDRAPFLSQVKVSVRAKMPSSEGALQSLMPIFNEDRHPGYSQKTIRLQISTWMEEMNTQQVEITSLNLILLRNADRADELCAHFADSVIGLMNRIGEHTEFEGKGYLFFEMCERFVQDFKRLIPFSGRDVWNFLRTPGGLLEQKNKISLLVEPLVLRNKIRSADRQDGGIARFISNVGIIDFQIKKLSSGEVAFLMLFTSLASALLKLEPHSSDGQTLLIIDEGEMFLHPSWQRKYLKNLVEFISKFPNIARGIHLIASTHSLIVAADAPPNSLFDVRTGEMKNSFGLGPAAVLSEVYHVSRFAGTLSAELIDKMIVYLKNPASDNSYEIKQLADSLADVELKNYVLRELERRALEYR